MRPPPPPPLPRDQLLAKRRGSSSRQLLRERPSVRKQPNNSAGLWRTLGILALGVFILLIIHPPLAIPLLMLGGVALTIHQALEKSRQADEARMLLEEAATRLKLSDGSPDHKENYVRAARAYYSIIRKDGLLTPYDEQKIATDLAAITPGTAIRVSGNYIDNRQTIYSPDPNKILFRQESIESAILRAIRLARLSGLDGASRAWLLEKVSADKGRLAEALEALQLSGIVEIGNRADGTMVFRLNELSD